MSSDIGVRLTGDSSEFRSMLDKAGADAGKFAGDVTAKTADKLLGLRDVSHTIATALGLNLESIAENFSRMILGMTKEDEEALKKLEEVSTRVADNNIKNMRATLTDEQQYQLLLQDKARLLKQVADANEAVNKKTVMSVSLTGQVQEKTFYLAQTQQQILKTKELELALSEKQKEITDYEKKVKEEAHKETLKFVEEEAKTEEARLELGRKQQMEFLTLKQKEEVIVGEINVLKEQINDGSLEGNELQKARNLLVAREGELLAVTKEEQTKHIATLQNKHELTAAALPIEEKILAAQQNIATLNDIITVAKKEHTLHDEEDVALLESKNDLTKLLVEKADKDKKIAEEKADILKRQTEIQDILSKGVGALTEDDKERLKTLAGENGVLKEQIKIVGDLTKQFEGFTVAITRTGSDYQSQSTTALQGVLAKLKSQINPLGDLPGASSGSVTSNQNYGAYLNNAAIKPEIQAIERELALRLQIQTYAARYGNNAATYQFGDADTQRALRDQTAETTQVKNALHNISGQLAASGLFPLNSPAPR